MLTICPFPRVQPDAPSSTQIEEHELVNVCESAPYDDGRPLDTYNFAEDGFVRRRLSISIPASAARQAEEAAARPAPAHRPSHYAPGLPRRSLDADGMRKLAYRWEVCWAEYVCSGGGDMMTRWLTNPLMSCPLLPGIGSSVSTTVLA